ncbi:MAG: protein-disulfide reductase DsbD domain-containing protein [Fimbriimonadaceae bacterium]
MLISAFLAANIALAPLQAEDPTVKIVLDHTSAVIGAPISGKAIITFSEGLHAYQNPPSQDYQIPVVVSAGDETIKVVKLKYPDGESHAVGGETEASFTYSGQIEVPFLIKAAGKPGSTSLKLKVRYQQCTDSMCFPPKTLTETTKVTLMSRPKGWTAVAVAAKWAKALSEMK